jgi:hypothetical protein
MPRYESFPIAPLQTGLFTAREPWMTPQDGFPVLLDARVDRGYLQKRSGYTELADTGSSSPIMGIHTYMRNGHPSYLVATRKRLYRYRPYEQVFIDLSQSDVFTGSDKDFFWFETWRDKCYFCNGVDGIWVYDEIADTLAEIDTISDADTDVQVESAKMIFVSKNRLIFVSPVIAGTWYPRRAYYTEILTNQVKATNYVNGDIPDVPVSGCYIQNVPTVFGHEGYITRLNYTYNTDTPFSWEEADRGNGVLGPIRPVVYHKRAILVGHSRLVSWDGYQIQEFGPQIRDFVSDIDNFHAWYMQATLSRGKNRMYLAYPSDGASANNRILEYNLDEDTFAIHKIAAHTLFGSTGHVAAETSLVEDEFGTPSATGELDYRSTDILRHPTYGPMTLMGDSAGKLYLLDYGSDDDGTDIEPEIWTANLNPFYKQGRKAYFGKVRLLVSNAAGTTATVGFYKDFGSTAYKEVTLEADGTGTKQWIELNPDGECGDIHRMKFSGLLNIHAMELFMAPGGTLDGGASDGISTIDATSASAVIWRHYQNDDGELELQKLVAGTWTHVADWDV